MGRTPMAPALEAAGKADWMTVLPSSSEAATLIWPSVCCAMTMVFTLA